MANKISAAKRARQSTKRAAANRAVITGLRSALKKANSAVASGNKADAEAAARALSSKLDKAAKIGRIHKNKASRHKATIAKQIAKLA